MIEVHYKTANGRMTFKVSGEGDADIFAGIAKVQEVFEAEPSCAMCNGEYRLVHRVVDGNDYYELRCKNTSCRARFEFGQLKKGGGLFPRRKNKDGEWLPNRGWAIYSGKEGKADAKGEPWGS